MAHEGKNCHKLGTKILLTALAGLHIIQIKGCSWGVQTALLIFPTFHKKEPGSTVRLCHAPVLAMPGEDKCRRQGTYLL